jgi:glycosyltransferase involved in cell wall biosynthesis
MVFYCSNWLHPCNWDSWPRAYHYPYKVLPKISVRTHLGEFYLNPTIVFELIKLKPDVLIINGYTDPTTWFAFAVARLLKIPIIHWTEGIKEPNSVLGKMTRPLRMLFIKKPDAVVVPGKLSKDYVTSFGVESSKVFFAPNAIDNGLFVRISDRCAASKHSFKDQLGLSDEIIILYVGQLIERKGLKYLLQAYSRIEKERDDIALLVLGRGPQESNLRNLADFLGIRRFKIMRPGLRLEELIAIYSAADIFVLPTLEDVWGFVINEAMICGLPVVSTRSSQAALEMVHSGENGYVIKEGDSEELYVALKNLIRDPTERERMGSRSKEIAMNRFAISHMVEGFLSAIKYCTKLTRK